MELARLLFAACLFGVLASGMVVLAGPAPDAAAWLALPACALAAWALAASAAGAPTRGSAHAQGLLAGGLALAASAALVTLPYQLASPAAALYGIAFLLAAILLAFATVLVCGVVVLSRWHDEDGRSKPELDWDLA